MPAAESGSAGARRYRSFAIVNIEFEKGAANMQTIEKYEVKKAVCREIEVDVPGSKSITNRALLIAALAEGKSVLRGVLFSDDSRHFLQALIDLGFEVEIDEENAVVTENVFNAIVTKLLYKLPNLDRRIIQKRFGIDYPYQLSIHDIAENESISSTTVKESLEKSLKFLNDNISAQDKEILCELIR